MIDSHAHLTDSRFQDEVTDVVERARDAGVEAIVTIGTGLADSRAAAGVAALFPDVFAVVGIHPHDASSASAESLREIRELTGSTRVVAIGETGLDYHYDFSPRDAQRKAFSAQLSLAAELDLPVVIHAREADADMIDMIREHGREVKGVLHSFSSGPELLHAALDLGWYASFNGMITFKSFDAADLLRAVPADRLMVETDSPYLTPVPHRGKRNEPAHVALVVERAAALLGSTPAMIAETTTANTRRFYALPDPGRSVASSERPAAQERG